MNTRLKYVRLQYRPVTGGEWIIRKTPHSDERDKKFNFLCPYSRGNGCRFKWDTAGRFDRLLSGFKDGKYELRLKTFAPRLTLSLTHPFTNTSLSRNSYSPWTPSRR